jgi:hypothetical protein
MLSLITFLACTEESFNHEKDPQDETIIPGDVFKDTASETGPIPEDGSLWDIAKRYYDGEKEALDEIKNWDDANIVIEYIKQLEVKEQGDGDEEEFESDTGAPVMYWTSGLPDCNVFYSSRYDATWATYTYTGVAYLYDWTANCYMAEKNNACGGDGDNLVSFWMGPDYVCPTAEAPYSVYGTKASISAWLYLKQLLHTSGANTRIYYSSDGRYANAYFCLRSDFNPENLHFGRW